VDFISLFLKENGYGNKTLFLRAVENLELVEARRVEKEFSNFPTDLVLVQKVRLRVKRKMMMKGCSKIFNPKWVLLQKSLEQKKSCSGQRTIESLCIDAKQRGHQPLNGRF